MLAAMANHRGRIRETLGKEGQHLALRACLALRARVRQSNGEKGRGSLDFALLHLAYRNQRFPGAVSVSYVERPLLLCRGCGVALRHLPAIHV
jgi:hypothetical protein